MTTMKPSSKSEAIEALRQQLGDRLFILGHHYQNDAIIKHTDLRGDSLELARKIPDLSAEYIVFCGVYFMAETAAVLSTPEQKVFIPDDEASCIMSDMAPDFLVDAVLTKFIASGRKIIPLTYVNSSSAVKAVCGKHGGSVCTSANAKTMMEWARSQGDGVLFLPDRNLGENTADVLGIAADKRHTLEIKGLGTNIDPAAVADKELLLWPGMCVIHHRIKPEHIDEIRSNEPEAKIIVHPECRPGVVRIADASGSTSQIIKYVEDAPQGSTIYIGTEINLVARLGKLYEGKKQIKPLLSTACKNMAKITEGKLLDLLENINAAAPVVVSDEEAELSKLALERMLEACK